LLLKTGNFLFIASIISSTPGTAWTVLFAIKGIPVPQERI